MSGRVNSRRGSALLIVLGMLSFMVISAVAFSMFMRDNRLPSSFLRQKVVSNHLVKAALANAMDEIDAAIGSHPYPGVTENGQSRGGVEKNYWKNRIFMGQSGEGLEEWSDDTVSTLTLEALAYLPPPLINTARFWSRRTPTAQWQPLSYDAGRYAYTAINVSDYLDINRLKAGAMRDSSSSNRVSFAYLFENDSHTGPASGASPEKFDEFITKTRQDEFKTRLVSLADYNMAIASGKYGDIGFKSPFCEYFSGDGNGLIYSGVNSETIKRQQFVTDSWYPGSMTNDSNAVYLTEDQPFDRDGMSLQDLMDEDPGARCYDRLRKQMDVVSFGALYDYLDEDSVPISLAIPTIERTPMFTGLSVLAYDFGISMQYSDAPLGQDSEKKPIIRRTWTLRSIGGGSLDCAAHGVYPFRRSSSRSEKTSYDVEVLVKCFFSSDDFEFSSKRLTGGLSLRPKNKSEWKADDALSNDKKAWITFLATGKATVNPKRESEEDCEVNIKISPINVPSNVGKDLGVYGLKFTKGKETSAEVDLEGIEKPLLYYDASGKIKSIKQKIPAGLKLNFALWFRILDGDGNTVDLVPATLADDKTYNNLKSLFTDDESGEEFCGAKEPVLPLQSSGPLLNINLEAFRNNIEDDTPGLPDDAPTFGDLLLCCGDPRYNFAPEDWHVPSDDKWSTWLTDARDLLKKNASAGATREIFQFVSDVGYLQSMGELQFLPATHKDPKQAFRVYPPPSNAIGTDCDYLSRPGKYNGEFAANVGATANAEYAWRTHWAFGRYADWASDVTRSPYMWGVKDTRDGATVTPYSASDDLLMAGLANTPYDWAIAGYAADGEISASEGLKKYCFNAYSGSEAPFEWDDLCDVAAGMRECFIDGYGWDNDLSKTKNTADKWNEYWYGDKDKFFGMSGTGIDDNDRRYLYSYWKNCFGDRQQLFLVFVRAEPSVLGGNTGRTPAQLGARAVALVWREPVSTISVSGSSGVPAHRMRILFYHQFD